MDITESCLDAETLAALVDGGLSGSALQRARAHVAECARCQAMTGTLVRMESMASAVGDDGPVEAVRYWNVLRRSPWLGWVVPAAAAAAGIAIWIGVPRHHVDNAPVTQISDLRQKQETTESRGAGAGAAAVDRPAPEGARTDQLQAPDSHQRSEPARAQPKPLAKVSPVDTFETKPPSAATGTMAGAVPEAPGRSNATTASEAGASPAASPTVSGLTAGAAGGRSGIIAMRDAATRDIISPDPRFRWRIDGSTVQRSTDGGAQWQSTATGTTAELTAGSAPSPNVCWVVGRGGVVLLSTDGRTWRRVIFPDSADLSGVRARDDRAASVTTADGRAFSTIDAGATWQSGSLQGF